MRCNTLLICDDHPPIRTAVTQIAREINRDIEIFEAGDAAEAKAVLEQHPDIQLMLLDIYMPGLSGLDLLSELKVRYPVLPVVVLSSDETRATVIAALERGASGYICKASPTDLLVKFLEHALNGNIALPIAVTLGAHAETKSDTAVLPSDSQWLAEIGLSRRQVDVLECLLRGMSNKQICAALGIAEGTVKTHTLAIFRAMRVTSRAQAVIEASRHGLLLVGSRPG